MTILAIGATGFIGPHVVRQLAQQGHDVTVFHRGETSADLPGAIRHLHGDRNTLSEHRAAFERLAPDVVIDLVPYTEAQAQQAVDVFSGLAERLVAISSSDVYRNYDGWRGASDHDPDPVPLDEDAPLRETRYPYRGHDDIDFAYADDYDKLLVEQVVMSAEGLASTILRLPAVYGPGDAQHRFAPYLRRMDDDRPAILMDERQARWRWTHGYVENVAAAIVQATTDDRAARRIYNVGEAKTPTEAERVEALGRVVGWTGKVVPLPADQLPEHLQAPFDWRYELATDTRRFREEVGFRPPVPVKEALRRTVAWERAQRFGPADRPDYAAEDEALRRWSAA
ncbi:MAG: NAD-dependent epimerase/dehydratase family protein [Bacteroidetes bacterium]|jgi:nucleoside-diphosphate-sugar epimerase|nr:NAD-dependent epimerase/dehydratase family protein [Bacteroidota bacterium]